MLTPKASLEHLPIQRAEAAQLMYDILQAPEVGFLLSLSVASKLNDSVIGFLHPRSPILQFHHTLHNLWKAMSTLRVS